MSKLATWDITISKNLLNDVQAVKKFLKEWCKKWAFQGEEGESGYLHWQCRVSLIKQKEMSTIKNLVKSGKLYGHWSPTCNTVHQGTNFNYVLKADTRIDGEGPFTDQDEDAEPPPLTRQLKTYFSFTPYEWQAQVEGFCRCEEDRSIKLIYDTTGNAGKSIFAEAMEYKGLALEIEPFNNMEDIMGCVMDQKVAKAYLVDMPRGLKKDKMWGFYSGLECLKNGKAFDKRYHYRKKRFDRPQVIVFTNDLPDFELMSPDRWEIYEMKDKKLVQWTQDEIKKYKRTDPNSNKRPRVE